MTTFAARFRPISAFRCVGWAALWLAPVFAGCGGGGAPAETAGPPAAVSKRTVPHFRSDSEMLALPQLRVADRIHTDVTLRLAGDGSWQLRSAGQVRAATASDAAGAVLGAPGSSFDLAGEQTDATLTIPRVHVGTRVFGPVSIQLKGKRWAFAGVPQELKTLHREDFTANAGIRADESHHVVLTAGPDTAVQTVPMQLATRSYQFCMDAQAQGADSIALFDAAGTRLLALKAGQPCVTIAATQGPHRLEHRYGGTGRPHSVFMRHQASAATAASTAAAPGRDGSPSDGSPSDGSKSAAGPSPTKFAMATAPTFPGREYWVIADSSGRTLNYPEAVSTIDIGSTQTPPAVNVPATVCAGPMSSKAINQWSNVAFLQVAKDSFGATVQLGQPLGCQIGLNPLAGSYMAAPPYYGINTYVPTLPFFGDPDFDQYPAYTSGGSQPDQRDPNTFVLRLSINNQIANQFKLISTGIYGDGTDRPVRPVTIDYYGYLSEQFSGDYNPSEAESEQISEPLTIKYRYFPDGLPSWVTLAVGQVALHTGTNCSGAALITEATSISEFSSLQHPVTGIPALRGLGASFNLGLQVTATAYAGANYAGESQFFNQLTCNSGAFGATRWAPASIKVSVDTVTMVISTDSCEYCNLTGADFTGVDLANVKLRNANLSGVVLSNLDLSGADLRYASLQGAVLINTNLDGANLCAAQLNGSAAVNKAATLTGAHLRNTNLALANLDGARLSSASFYSGGAQGSCQQTSCGSYVAPTCASAYGASLNNASFDSAYLSNVDMGNVTGVAVNFSSAALFGVSFAGADLSHNNASSVSSFFSKAYLQGTDFSRANLRFADFTGAQYDPASSCIQANLAPAYRQFTGAKVPASPGSSSCVAGKPTAPFCVEALFAASPDYPPTDCTNICADGSRGGTFGPQNGTCQGALACSAGSWAAPLGGGGNSALPTSSCQAAAPLCGGAFSSIKDQCW